MRISVGARPLRPGLGRYVFNLCLNSREGIGVVGKYQRAPVNASLFASGRNGERDFQFVDPRTVGNVEEAVHREFS